MELHMESVRQGVIGGIEYTACFTELPDGQFMASIISAETREDGIAHHVTKICATKEEVMEAINDAWADLESALN
ncbi:hypothetical protein D3C74_131730 [compost metagenome]